LLELERKYLVIAGELTDILNRAKETLLISQWYLSDEMEVRIRTQVDNAGKIQWISTYKRGKGLIRIEKEHELALDKATDMFSKLRNSPLVTKLRRLYPGVNYEGVIDNYYFPELGFVTEVELKILGTQMPRPWEIWNLPQKYFREVSEDEKYTAWKLSKKPKIDLVTYMKEKLKAEILPEIQRDTFIGILSKIYHQSKTL